jgi:hypothetical protein
MYVALIPQVAEVTAELPYDGVLVVKCPGFVVDTGLTPCRDLIARDMEFGGSGSQEKTIEFQKYVLEPGTPETHLFLHFKKAVEIGCKNAPVDNSLTHRTYLPSAHKSLARRGGLQGHSAEDY